MYVEQAETTYGLQMILPDVGILLTEMYFTGVSIAFSTQEK